MFTRISFCLALLAVLATARKPSKEDFEACMAAHSGPSQDEIKIVLKDREFDKTTPEINCLLQCIMTKMGYMDESGYVESEMLQAINEDKTAELTECLTENPVDLDDATCQGPINLYKCAVEKGVTKN